MMLQVENLNFNYRKKMVFSDFSLSVESGKVYGLLGKNGAGKSTLLYLMMGLLLPRKGIIRYKEKNVSERLPSVLSEMFIVPEEFELPKMSLKKYISLNRGFYPNFSEKDLEGNLSHFELEPTIHLGALSLGQKKKVFMSFALATNTPLLIMDEPTNGLDIPGKSQFKKFIASKMTDERTIIISTHQVQDVEKLIDQVIIIDNDKTLMNSSVNEIIRKLRFANGESTSNMDAALYSAPSVLGYNALYANEEEVETEMNLETLFNAVLNNPEKINALFNN